MKQIKDLELISGVELAFGSCLTGAINMKSKDTLIQVKEAIIRMKTHDKSERQQKLQKWLNQQFGAYFQGRNALVSSTTSEGLTNTKDN